VLPVLFHVQIPPAWAKPAVVLLVLALALGRAFAFRRRTAAGGGKVSWAAALWDDRWLIGGLGLAAAVLWGVGLLDRELDLPLHTYGLLLASGFVVAIWLAQREAARQGQDPEKIGDLVFWILVAALVGSRVYYVLVNWNDYFGSGAMVTVGRGRMPRLLAFWEGGYVFYGGFIAAALAAWWYMRRRGMPFLAYADTLIPSVAMGQVLGRLGCFAAGCCWGSVAHSDLPWLARFPPASLAFQAFARRPDAARYLAPDGLTTLPLHPTQIYESAGELAIFFLLVAVIRPRKRFHGQVLASWLMLYAVLRTTVELFRGDVERGVVAGLGVGTWTSLAILAAGVAVMVVGRRRTSALQAAAA
jgi:phosphatidylglycerol:prolipoprotein diacylglycerol transferase